MTDNQDQDDISLDAPEDLGPAAPARPSMKEVWQANPLLKIGAAVLVAAVGIAGYTTITKPNPVEETKSAIGGADTRDVKAVPGKDALDKKYTEAIQKKNTQRAETAAATGGSAIPTPVATAKDQGLAIPRQSSMAGAADPLQEWKNNVQARKIKTEETSLEEDMAVVPPQPELVPLVQPVHPQPAAKLDPAVSQALAGQMRTIIDTQKPEKSKVVLVTTRKSEYDEMITEMKEKKAKTGAVAEASSRDGAAGGTTSAAAKAKVIIPAGNIFYAQLLMELNSDIPAPALAMVMSGPFAGARMMGKMSKTDEYLVITFNRIIKDDVNYKINGIALDEATTLPAMQSEVDHHYFDRIVIPAAAKFVTGYSDALSQTGSSTTTTSGGGVATSQPKPDAKESFNKGLNSAAQSVTDVMTENIKKDVTVKVTRGATMGVLLLDPVTTADVEGK